MLTHIRAAIVSLVLFTVVTGVAYPVLVTVIAQLVFPNQANGSLIVKDGKGLGSRLIGQPFDDPKYFWSRPSATSPFGYNAGASGASNLSPTNADLVIEIAGSSQRRDRHVKGPLYARAGVPEYWLFDLTGRAAEVHRHPQGAQFTSVVRLGEHETLHLLRFPDVEVSTSGVLPTVK